MPHLDGAHTHGHDGGGAGDALAVIAAGAVAAAIGGPIIAAVASLLMTLLIAAAITLGVTITGLLALTGWRLRGGPRTPTVVLPPLSGPAQMPQQTPRPAVEAPRELHLHLHGISADDVAAILRHHQEPGT